MEEEGQRLRLPKLARGGANWVTYKDRIVWALQASSIDDHLVSATPPDTYIALGIQNNLSADARWKKEEGDIKAVFAQTLPDTAFNKIKPSANIKAAWDGLKALYEDRSKALVADVIRQFRNKRCGEDESVRAHFETFADLREQLASMGKEVTDDDYADTLMASLPRSYDSAVQSITAGVKVSNNKLSANIFEGLILDEYERRKIRDKIDGIKPKDEALAADSGKKPDQDRDKRKVECFNCKKKGHYKSDCWAKGGGKEGQGPRRGKNANNNAASAEEKPESGAWAAIEDTQEPETWMNANASAAGSIPARSEQQRSGTVTELYDSGASRHMSPFRDRFTSYKEIPPRAITAADKRVFYAIGTGDLKIEVPNGESLTPITLKDVLHAPDMGITIVSVSRIAKAGYAVTFKDNACQIRDKSDKVIGTIPASQNGLYKVDRVYAAATQDERVSLATLHRRLAHISPDAIRKMVKNGSIEGIQLIDDGSTLTCETCEQAKATRKEIRKEREAPLAAAFGDEVHTDLWGPSPVPSLGGRAYYVTFTDDYSRFTKLTPLRTKDQTLEAYKSFASWAHTQHGVKVKRLRSDRGGEYTGDAFSKFLAGEGTERRLTTHDTPQHNGVAESLNRRLMERVRAVIIQADLPKSLWAEAAQFVIWLKNRSLTRVLGDVTPYERLTGQKPNLAGVPEWGQRVWVHNDSGSKLDGRASAARWVGYDADSTHAHRIYWPETRRISVERNIRFKADSVTIRIPSRQASTPAPVPAVQQPATVTYAPQAVQQLPPATDSGEEEVEIEDELDDQTPTPAATPRRPKTVKLTLPSPPVPQPTRQSMRARKPSALARRIEEGEGTADGNLSVHVDASSLTSLPAGTELEWVYLSSSVDPPVIEGDPKSVPEARSRSDWPSWKEAMDHEMGSLDRTETWITVARPPGKNIISCKWVFRLKRKADESIDKYKARLVARGFAQLKGVDYFDTYSPVARLASFRMILALAAQHDWEIDAFDFDSAYLNGKLNEDEEIYMEEPPGYQTSGGGYVKRLQKSLYGLKQAGRKWYDALSAVLTQLGFRVSNADLGVFTARIGDDILILAVHVDDCILTGSNKALIDEYKKKLHDQYSLTDLGPVDWLLGIKITRDREARTISLSQSGFIKTILARFALTDAKSFPTPMIPGAVYSKKDSPTTQQEIARMRPVPYREAIGSLMYASVATRPDITFAVSTLSQFLDNPGEAHWEAVKRVFRYLSGTRDQALTYGGEVHDLLGFTDADGASQEHRRAISGHAFLFNGGAVSWSSRKQELVTLSTAEAEYVAATHASKELIWLRRLKGDLSTPLTTATPLYCDNQAALRLAQADDYRARTKHIDLRYHFIRNVVERGEASLAYCPTDEMTADVLTKALPRWKVSQHSLALGLGRPCGGVLESGTDESGAPAVPNAMAMAMLMPMRED